MKRLQSLGTGWALGHVASQHGGFSTGIQSESELRVPRIASKPVLTNERAWIIVLISDIALRQHQSGTPIYQFKVESGAKCRWGVDKTRWGSKFSSAKPVEGKKDHTLTSRQTQCSERIKIYIYIYSSILFCEEAFLSWNISEWETGREGRNLPLQCRALSSGINSNNMAILVFGKLHHILLLLYLNVVGKT